ncbi:DUF7336 domain-containing protein [Chitiniphilus eburneus]|uniref:DUF7336 domain-containing protein n=1 Tax=Chitiniphilus eburneus TaxID=2571148 RepID=A0A4U0Q4V8_9NEIS|nr:hypothetical protein [Chitiniphilus eburneus]TJZ76196.1 hypothetical protein FAZ21_05315 [Chitiniphilus eburneus]
MNVYILQHTYGDDETESYKFLGVFESKIEAEKAIEFLKNLPGFRDYPDGFSIGKYTLNEIHWREGFGWDA